jgi:transposase
VWRWISQYNRQGPAGLARKGRGGRRWAFLTLGRERELLAALQEEAGRGQVLTAKQIHGRVRQAVGKKVSLDYVYRLLHRHGWRKLGPRPRHVEADPQAQAEFKKNCRNSSRKR